MDIRLVFSVFSLIYFLLICITSGLPVTQEKTEKKVESNEENNEKKIESEIDDLGLEYGRYLQQVVEALETDKQFARKLENVSQEEIKNGAIARELDFVNHNVRNKLDELKRIEMDRLRQLAKKEKQLQDNQGMDDGRRWRTVQEQIQFDAEHLDHQNPHSFEAEDLQKLILSATKDLEELDAKRREDFKKYEMEKEIIYREALVNMTDEERQETIKKHDQMQEKHKQHPKVHHPGSKKQLEQVWEEQDKMPREEFNPKIFFTLHDVNGDGFLDPQEVEAILTIEIKKMYSEKNSEDDPNEMQEEYHRMREHIYKEADVNRDGLISKKEFLDFTHRMEFEKDDGWKGLDEQQVYSEEDLKKFQEQQRQHYEEQQQYQAYQQYQQQYYPEGYHVPQQQHHPSQQQQQHYIPPPHQLTPEQWHQQQQYYQQLQQQQYYGHPNPNLHQQNVQYVVHQQPNGQQVQVPVQQQHPQIQQQIPQQHQQQVVHQQQVPQQHQQQVPQQHQQQVPQQHQQQVPQQQHQQPVYQQAVPQQVTQQGQPQHPSQAVPVQHPVPQSGH